MFTGIITDIGVILEVVASKEGDVCFTVACAYDHKSIDIGASISCSGICLTVTDKGDDNGQNWFKALASGETLEKTIAKKWQQGTKINLERALKYGDEMGGHMVSGHVDTTTIIDNVENAEQSKRFTFLITNDTKPFIASKGSVTLNGTSLTVNNVYEDKFDVNIIPHTLENTCWGDAKVGDTINIEIDTIARYIKSLMKQVK